MKQLSTCQKIRWAVKHCPLLLDGIIANNNLNKELTNAICRSLVPRRTSIEIECLDSLVAGLIKTNKLDEDFSYEKLLLLYEIYSFNCDYHHNNTTDYNEHRISILNYTQLKGLYNILKDMSKFCKLNTESGIHIHLDLSNTLKYSKYNKNVTLNRLNEFLTTKCKNGKIEKIFGPYVGKRPAECSLSYRNYWIYINMYYPSIEFRTPPQTFNYSTIIKWFIDVNKILTEFEKTISNKQRKVQRKKR